MAATYTKPTKIPRWADIGTRVEPSGGKKDTGWTFEEAPPYGYENWLQGISGDWFKWIDERFFDGATKDELFLKYPGTGSTYLKFLSSGLHFNTAFLPDTTSALDIGGAANKVRRLYIDDIYEYEHGHICTKLNTSFININSAGLTNVTPVSVIENGGTFGATTSPNLRVLFPPTNKGRYLVCLSLAIANASAGDTIAIELHDSGGLLASGLVYVDVTTAVAYLVPVNFIVAVTATSEIFQVHAKTLTGGVTAQITDNTRLSITCIRQDP